MPIKIPTVSIAVAIESIISIPSPDRISIHFHLGFNFLYLMLRYKKQTNKKTLYCSFLLYLSNKNYRTLKILQHM